MTPLSRRTGRPIVPRPHQRKLTEIDEAALLLDAEDTTQLELAALYGVSQTTISAHLRRLSPDRPQHPRRRRYPESVKRRAAELYAEGLSFEAIGRELGAEGSTVRKWIMKQGMQPR